ncbi:MAG: transposase [Deltaproteobacteria bacterium]|nr:transposase [Deltaproteobacteria bacterium]
MSWSLPKTSRHWLLWTTLPVDTEEQISRVVDIYRKRWLIEEHFKALKTGCSLEKRQARSLGSWLNTAALRMPQAWRLLRLRLLSRKEHGLPASVVFSPLEVRILQQLVPKAKLRRAPKLRAAMLAVANLEGFQRSNGEPVWLILGRGLEKLLTAARGARALLELQREGGDFEM